MLFLLISVGPENIHVEISPLEELYEEGATITLKCSADSRPPAQFTWILNENLLPDAGAELRLINVQSNQSGNYSCQVFNNKTLGYQASQSVIIVVQGKCYRN